MPPSVPLRVLGPGWPPPAQPCADGEAKLKLPVPPCLPAELFTRKDLGRTEPGDSSSDFLTEDEDGKPRLTPGKGPGDREEMEVAQALVHKRGKVSVTSGAAGVAAASSGGSFPFP